MQLGGLIEVDTLKELGVKVETNMVIGRVLSIDELMDDYGFESVFINLPVRCKCGFCIHPDRKQ